MHALTFLPILAQVDGGVSEEYVGLLVALGLFAAAVGLGLALLMFVGMWKIFAKAGHPGWAAIVPFYNVYIMCLIARKEPWWVILFFIPFLNTIASILISLAIADQFDKSPLFGFGMAFLPFIFYPLLGFSDARYRGGAPAFA